MNRVDYDRVCAMLDKALVDGGAGHGLSGLSASGKITLARHIGKRLDEFCTETLAREKARLSSLRDEEKHLAEEFGEEWAKVEPSWVD